MSERNMVIYTGTNGVREYLKQFFKSIDSDITEEKLNSEVELAYNWILDNPNTPNIFGITTYKK